MEAEEVDAEMTVTITEPIKADVGVLKFVNFALHEYFYEPSSRPQIAQMMSSVIATEGPVYESVLRKRVSKAWGLTRMTENVHRVLDASTPRDVVVTEHESGKVCWPKGTDVASYREFRVPSVDPNSKRSLEEIPPQELMNAMCEILTDLGGCHQDELYRETIKQFGLSTLTAKARKFLDVAFALLQSSDMI